MSWKVMVRVRDEKGLHGNNLRFPTKNQASEYAIDLLGRWLLVEETLVTEAEEKVNYMFLNGKLEKVQS